MKILSLALLLCISSIPAAAGERFYCNLKALSPSERTRHQELSRSLLTAVVERAELPNGYGFRISAKELPLAAEWIGFESRCCPFFGFEIQVSKEQGPIWLRVTGGEGVKPFIRAEFGI